MQAMMLTYVVADSHDYTVKSLIPRLSAGSEEASAHRMGYGIADLLD